MWASTPSNESERMPRKVVIFGKIRFRMAGRTSARMFPNIMTCVPTWRKRNLNVLDMLLRALKGILTGNLPRLPKDY